MGPVTASVFYVKNGRGVTLPVLVADDEDGNPQLVPEASEFASHLAAQNRHTTKSIRSWITVLALFLDHVRLIQNDGDKGARKDGDAPHGNRVDQVSWFLNDRLSGVESADGLLKWPPVKSETVERDRFALTAFAEFCSEKYGTAGEDEPQAKPRLSDGFRNRSVADRLKDPRVSCRLLAHLEARKALPEANGSALSRTSRRGGSRRSNLTKAEVDRLILSTKSDAQKMAFILAAFGGLRQSEILQMWICDVHEGIRRPAFFPSEGKSDLPLVLVADPAHSRHVDFHGGRTETRTQVLAAKGARPRSVLPPNDPLRAGWKGIAYENPDLLVSQVHWTDRAWAHAFLELFRRHRDSTLSSIPKKDLTPYVFVNDAREKEQFGRPTTASNLSKAFLRACARAGVDTSKVGGMHSLRHFYTETLKRLGLAQHEIQACMHHRSIKSQSSYGNDPAILSKRLSDALGEDAR